MSVTILITPRSATQHGHPALDRLRSAGWSLRFCRAGRQPDEDELLDLLPGCAGYLAGTERITARTLQTATSLRVISRNGTGVDGIDLPTTAQLGIVVRRAEGANARGVAELVIAHLFTLARGLSQANTALKAGSWSRPTPGIELQGRTLGLIGFGHVGQTTARLATALGLNVFTFDPIVTVSTPPPPGVTFAPISEVVAAADFLSLHCPPQPNGAPLIDAATLALQKPGSFLINTARHELVDPEAALDALNRGHLAGMAIDVFDSEPPTDQRLIRHPRVLATPHLGGYTRESIDRAMHTAVDNLLESLAIQAPLRDQQGYSPTGQP